MTSVTPTPYQDAMLASVNLMRLSVHARLTAILAAGNRSEAQEATVVAKWLDDGTVAAQALAARAGAVARFLEVHRHV